jgi:hypothetical protein
MVNVVSPWVVDLVVTLDRCDLWRTGFRRSDRPKTFRKNAGWLGPAIRSSPGY